MTVYLGIGLIFALYTFRCGEKAFVRGGKRDEDFAEVISNKFLTIAMLLMCIVAWPYWLIRLMTIIYKKYSKTES